MKFIKYLSFYKLSNDTLVSAVFILVKKIFTKNRSDVHYFLTDFNNGVQGFWLCASAFVMFSMLSFKFVTLLLLLSLFI